MLRPHDPCLLCIVFLVLSLSHTAAGTERDTLCNGYAPVHSPEPVLRTSHILPACLPDLRQGAAAAVWRSQYPILVGGGVSAGDHCKSPYTELDTVLISPARGQWRQLAKMPSGRIHPSAVVINDMLYILGGFGAGPCSHSPPWSKGKCAHSSVWSMDLTLPTPVAVPKTDMPFNRSNFGAVAVNGQIYTVGGYGNYGNAMLAGSCTQADVNIYHPANDTWHALPPMPTRRAGLALVLLGESLLFAIGGFQCTNGPAHTVALTTVEALDLKSGEWRIDTPLPAARVMPGSQGAVMTGNSSVMLVGGFNGTSGGDMSVADVLKEITLGRLTLNNSLVWTDVSEVPTRRGFVAVVAVNESVLVMGGYNPVSGNDSALVEVLDTRTFAWQACVPKL